MRIYLNNSALNRPFDDRGDPRVQVEADAVLALLRAFESKQASMVSSEFLEVEAASGPPGPRAERIRDLLELAAVKVRFSDAINTRALALEPTGLRGFDALHVASAEAGQADLLVTTEDRMMRRARRVNPSLAVRVVDPVEALRRLDAGEVP